MTFELSTLVTDFFVVTSPPSATLVNTPYMRIATR